MFFKSFFQNSSEIGLQKVEKKNKKKVVKEKLYSCV